MAFEKGYTPQLIAERNDDQYDDVEDWVEALRYTMGYDQGYYGNNLPAMNSSANYLEGYYDGCGDRAEFERHNP